MSFDKEKTINYWVEGSEYDLATAESLYDTGKFPYALFFGHLAMEKLLKALVVKQTEKHAPFTHSLPLLMSKLTIDVPDEIKDNLNYFMEFFIEARYPDQQRDFYNKCTSEFTRKNLDKVREVYQWFLQKLNQ